MLKQIQGITALITILGALCLAPPSEAKCRRHPSIFESLEMHRYAFAGRVVLDLSTPERQQVLVYPLIWYKPKHQQQPLLVVRNAEPPFACATRFYLGQTYVFFSNTPVAPWIHEVQACDPNQAFEQLSPQDKSTLSAYAN